MTSTYFSPTAQPVSENKPPAQWAFAQPTTATYNGGHIQVKPNQIRVNKKRTSSRDEEDEQLYSNFSATSYVTPTKRRKGLSDATVSSINSPFQSNTWGNRS